MLRTLRMLIQLSQESDRPQHVPPLHRYIALLLEAIDDNPGLHRADKQYLRSLSSNDTDPADHSHPAGMGSTTDARPRR
jgi:hypothetical protein